MRSYPRRFCRAASLSLLTLSGSTSSGLHYHTHIQLFAAFTGNSDPNGVVTTNHHTEVLGECGKLTGPLEGCCQRPEPTGTR